MTRTKMIAFMAMLIVGGIALWFFPLFHVRPLNVDATESESQAARRPSASVDPSVYASEVWSGPVRAGATSTSITELWGAFDADPANARTRYGRQPGLGGAWYFCVRGQGTVEAVDSTRVVLAIADCSRRVCLDLGVVVDNRVRDAIGVKASEFANSQAFNAVSSELNRRAEQDVIAANRDQLKKGMVVDFVGCAEVRGKSDLDPLSVVPIHIQTPGSDSGHDGNAHGDKDNVGLNKGAAAEAIP